MSSAPQTPSTMRPWIAVGLLALFCQVLCADLLWMAGFAVPHLTSSSPPGPSPLVSALSDEDEVALLHRLAQATTTAAAGGTISTAHRSPRLAHEETQGYEDIKLLRKAHAASYEKATRSELSIPPLGQPPASKRGSGVVTAIGVDPIAEEDTRLLWRKPTSSGTSPGLTGWHKEWAAQVRRNQAHSKTSASYITALSVIIPVYNMEATIDRALGSVEASIAAFGKAMQQRYQTDRVPVLCEVIIFDDASTDGTQQAIAEFINPDLSKVDLGFGAASPIHFLPVIDAFVVRFLLLWTQCRNSHLQYIWSTRF